MGLEPTTSTLRTFSPRLSYLPQHVRDAMRPAEMLIGGARSFPSFFMFPRTSRGLDFVRPRRGLLAQLWCIGPARRSCSARRPATDRDRERHRLAWGLGTTARTPIFEMIIFPL